MGHLNRGFTFCGQHSGQFGLIWSELPEDIFATDHEIDYKSEVVSGVPGAIPHGYNVKPREFHMVCGFVELSEGQRSRISVWLRAGRYGRLVMDHRPYCYYNVIVTSGVKWAESFPRFDLAQGVYLTSGHIEFTLTAFVPYAYLLDDLTLETAAARKMLRPVQDGTAILPAVCAPGITGTHALLHNAGNARAKLNLLLSGILGPDGVTILNHSTGQQLHIAGDTQAHVYHVDSEYGRVEEVVEDELRLASHVHSGDYIELLPGAPMERNIPYRQTGDQLRLQGYQATPCDIGRYFFHGSWSRITAAQDGVLTLDCDPAEASGIGQLTQLNDIEVIRGAETSLEITFKFKATFY